MAQRTTGRYAEPFMASRRVETPPLSDEELVVGLRDGDDAAFLMVVERYHASLVQLAQTFVHVSAADVVRGALTDVLSGLASFDGRSSLRVWLFRAVIDQARARSPLAESLTS